MQGWPSAVSNGQTATNGTANGGVYGSASGGQQAGYGTGQEGFAQSTSYPGQAAYGAFGQQQTGYGGSQVCSFRKCAHCLSGVKLTMTCTMMQMSLYGCFANVCLGVLHIKTTSVIML